MTNRPIVLTDRQETVIRRLISQGRYRNADEVLDDVLSVIERFEAMRADRRLTVPVNGEGGRAAAQTKRPRVFTALDCWVTQLQPPSGTA